MRRWNNSLQAIAVALPLLVTSIPVAAGAVRGEHSEAMLLSKQASVAPGGELRVALRLVHDDGWHSYWVNPGDSGLATRLRWHLPDGWQAGDIDWPTPHRFELDGIHNFGYDGEVSLPLTLRAPADATPGARIILQADARWLVCKDICVSEKVSLELPVSIGLQESTTGQRWNDIDASLPRAAVINQGRINATGDGFDFRLDGLPAPLTPGTRVGIFPRSSQWLSHRPLSASVDAQRQLRFSVARNDYFTGWPQQPVLLLKPEASDLPAYEAMLDLPPPDRTGDAR